MSHISSSAKAINRCQGQSSRGWQKGDEAVTLIGVEITNSPYDPSGHPKFPGITCHGLSYTHKSMGFYIPLSSEMLNLEENFELEIQLNNSGLIWFNQIKFIKYVSLNGLKLSSVCWVNKCKHWKSFTQLYFKIFRGALESRIGAGWSTQCGHTGRKGENWSLSVHGRLPRGMQWECNGEDEEHSPS